MAVNAAIHDDQICPSYILRTPPLQMWPLQLVQNEIVAHGLQSASTGCVKRPNSFPQKVLATPKNISCFLVLELNPILA